MSSSASPAPVPSLPPESRNAPPQMSPFPYLEVRPSTVRRTLPPGGLSTKTAGDTDSGLSVSELAQREAQARELGRQQGIVEASQRFEKQLVQERAAIAATVSQFGRERADYYNKIEEEAVQLSLSIARKILHRESQVDPLLLMGIVRVALDKIENATEVKLAVNPQRAADWKRYLASAPTLDKPVEIVEDPALPFEQCELRTSMGSAKLGVEVQLKEIELGLMDLLAARPRVEPQRVSASRAEPS
jgi:flagellar assembly protein FliH